MEAKTEAMQAYEREKEAAKMQVKEYQPQDTTIEELRDFMPRFPFGGAESSMSIVRERMLNATDRWSTIDATRVTDLAVQLRRGNYVYFRSEEEKAAVLELARSHEQVSARRKSVQTGETVKPEGLEVETLSAKSKEVLERELLWGNHKPVHEQMKNKTVEGIMHLIRKNGTYGNADEARLLAKLSSLLPVTKPKPKQSDAGKGALRT